MLTSACGSSIGQLEGGAIPTAMLLQPNATATLPTSLDPRVSTEVPAELGGTIWIDPAIPAAFQSQLNIPTELTRTEDRENATLRLEVNGQNTISSWVLAFVAPFPTLTEGISTQEMWSAWRGDYIEVLGGRRLRMDAETYTLLTAWWGAADQDAVLIVPADEMLKMAWDGRPAWGIVPFDALEPRWKVLTIDNISPIQKGFAPRNYSLSVPISLNGDSDQVAALMSTAGPLSEAPLLPVSNRDADKLTTIALTGVTAMVRATAWEMERKGITYGATDIGEMLREADITHVSNEIPFDEDCPPPSPNVDKLVFCSAPKYIELLEAIGTDVIELTGDHFNDWGAEGTLYTIQMYKDRGWPYYGGGENLEDGREPVLFEHNGNKIAFIGCNAKGGGYATAAENTPGAVECDFPWFEEELGRLMADGYLPIFTFQHQEYYTFEPRQDQVTDFERVAQAGAVIVSGSQAHQAQGMEFLGDSTIMYGLGNLFFDQLGIYENASSALIARHVFYDGRHISTELIVIKFVDYVRPRFATEEERVDLLSKVFSGSGW